MPVTSRETPTDARSAAFYALTAYRRRGARPDMVLAANKALSERDMALAVNITTGAIQNAMLLDYCVSRWSGRDAGSLSPEVRDILRLSVYQILFLDRVPARAAVSEGVELAKRAAPRAAGLVNAVLRRATESGGVPDIDVQGPERLSILYSHPLWLVKELWDRFGPETCEAILRADNERPQVTAQVNTLRIDTEGLKAVLASEGVESEPVPGLPGALSLLDAGRIDRLDSFRRGLFFIQDASARLAVKAAELEPGMEVIDLCAAPGGKSFAAALDMGGRGRIRAFDIHEKKLPVIERTAERLGINIIETARGDGKVLNTALVSSADAVLVDAPCSGIGVIRKKPEIRFKPEEELAALPGVQLALLSNAANYVRPGGVLLYSTCTILRRENEDVVSKLLASRDDLTEEYSRTVLPGKYTDGFFICRMRRKN